MSSIIVSNLTFSYEGFYVNVFDNVSFTIDTNWKLGFIGRNGKGKTTFLNLLMGKYEYYGKIISNVNFDYFPFEVKDKGDNSYTIASNINPNYEKWKLEREVSLLEMNVKILRRPFDTLSRGEQTKILLAILFSRENNYLLIDEPTNHLDAQSREIVAKYLNNKNSFILVSHDRNFLDSCIDHVLSINRSNIEIQQGNFSSWWENKNRQDQFEQDENEKLLSDIKRLELSSKQTAEWSNKVEATKYGGSKTDNSKLDKGYIGHKAAKMMKRSIVAQNRRDKAINDKSKLLKNIETADKLKLNNQIYKKNKLIEVINLAIYYDNSIIFKNVNFIIENGDRLQLKGKNGCGKSSIIKLILGYDIKYSGSVNIGNDLKISYISQDTSHLSGNLSQYSKDNGIDETLFKTILRKLDFEREQFDKNIEDYSEGQKKKVLIAKSLSESSDLYIWDEPLNYIDVISRIQIEELILNYCPTMIFVEHDEAFSKKIATKVITL